jgi:hypothetical protein
VSFSGNRLSLHLSLLRIDPNGETQIQPKLLLHEETPAQKTYNRDLERALQFALTKEVKVESENRTGLLESLELEQFAEGSELQIVQFDEFQLPDLDNSGLLAAFDVNVVDGDLWSNAQLRERVETLANGKPTNQVIAFPYFRNVGLSTVLNTHADLDTTSWDKVVKAAREFKNKGTQGLFFDFPQTTGENINCLFFEMALEYLQRGGQSANLPRGGFSAFRAWLAQRAVTDTFKAFHELCGPARNAWQKRPSDEADKPPAPTSAIVTRQWFTTLRGFKARADEDWETFEIRPLPGKIAINGDWYLAVPSQCAVTAVGARIIKFMTSRHRQNERVIKGVGLPVNEAFYAHQSRFFPKKSNVMLGALGGLMKSAHKRSSISNYARISPVLTFYLLELLDMPSVSDEIIEELVGRLLVDCELAIGDEAKAMRGEVDGSG